MTIYDNQGQPLQTPCQINGVLLPVDPTDEQIIAAGCFRAVSESCAQFTGFLPQGLTLLKFVQSPPPPPPTPELDALSESFMAICAQADALLPAEYPGPRPFRGGFDEVLIAVEFIPTVPELAQLKNKLDAINAAWAYACNKAGISTGDQWHKMWGI